MYDSDWADVMASTAPSSVAPNEDSLALPRQESDRMFRELELRVERLIDPATQPDALEGLASWEGAPQPYRNIAVVLTAEALRRRGLKESAGQTMSRCTNPAYLQLWARWCSSRPGKVGYP